ncbi:MAG: flagellar motor protein [Clostridia bacterium]|nr:flagellar motor protein [Clostridia bacterium]MCL6520931.1 flagellar motor protein [Bacillota bacterium]
MDITLPLGLVIAVAAILGSQLMEGAHLAALLNPSAILLVLGGTVGATVVSSRRADVAAVPASLAAVFRAEPADRRGLLEELVTLAQKARREGLLAIEEDLAGVREPFLARGMQMVVDGSEPEMVREMLEAETEAELARWERSAAVLEAAGGYSPTMGIIGTVLGLVHVLGNLSDTSRIGPAIAVAFMATFYGIFLANVLWLPLGARIHARAQSQAEWRRVILEGILSVANGESPNVVREKLATLSGIPLGQGGEPPASRVAAREQHA